MADLGLALLLIPQMRRKKYTMKQTQYGRNMLIGEYLWIAYCQTLAPGEEPDPDMMRERKKVSSHIQVLKNFFANHRCFHFFFGPKQDDKDRDAIETVSLKNNTVLTALSDGRLPDERPNYEYFTQILALNDQIQVRPRRCWIFVSHQDVVVGEGGSGYLPATGDKLAENDYPHLARNLERETWAKEEQQIFKGSLLHEFTKEMHQVESSSVREMSKRWETAFPALHRRLKAITSTSTDSRCDVLHMHVTLELKEQRRFPSRSELNSWVEINIEQPRLLNHRWKVDTRLVRPSELSHSHDDSAPETVYETSDEIAIQYQHRPGCDGPRNDGGSGGGGRCDCISQRCRRDWVTVPFPADVWALTLTNCAEYPARPFGDGKRPGKARDAVVKPESDGDDEPPRRRRSRQPTQMDLVPKIAMMQEIWSCPPASPHENGAGSSEGEEPRWTRRALLLWTFDTIHSIDKDGKLVTAQGGRTNWRFLTILDPASEYHQRHAVISGRGASGDEYAESLSNFSSASRPGSRGVAISPSPTYQQQLNASMNDSSYSSAWDTAGPLGPMSGVAGPAAYGAHHLMSQPAPSHAAAVQAGYGLVDNFSSHSGLVTPPPTASLASSFAQSFDAGPPRSADLMPSYMGAHVTTAGMAAAAATDPFLAHVGATTYGEGPDSLHAWTSHGLAANSGVCAAAEPGEESEEGAVG
ncbi:hypothetical protein BT67DRAFT_183099 [Trichocladium antarcticum]|uniref:TEA domain-containing protein n=1 Tax=Trichocladium antarcticum TaxID=1450529 RepID=A0AAN6UPG5_9PEZI|nr:hypothetical protein BT67DRAFT_183099 [Trichocladium antarcticum]